jgi:glycosyltransferase involved in cell wall biosynthesis
MKVIYVGVWKDGTGWGHAAQDYILALDAGGVDVVPRAIRLNNAEAEIPDRILELEQKDDKNPDAIIQNVLPSMMCYDREMGKNIGLFFTETSHFKHTDWVQKLQLMDEMWAPATSCIECAINSGVNLPHADIPCACDASKYMQYYRPYDLPGIQDTFVFYTIGELTRRKNLVALLKAFHTEFTVNEPVSLVIKCNSPNHSTEETQKHARAICNKVKENMRLTNYKDEIILVSDMVEQEIMRLHATCDCFVMPSYGEAWCIPAFDAMCMGKTPIVNNTGGPSTYIGCGGITVRNHKEPAFGMTDGFPGLYTGDELWDSIDISGLRMAMRYIYSNSDARDRMAARGVETASEYSHEKIGKIMKESLNAALSNRSTKVGKKHNIAGLAQ